MTIKEISEAVGKDERTVQRWVKRLSNKMSLINDKMSSSSPMHPANFDLDETVAIIEEGMGKNAAGIFRMNAQQKPNENTRLDRLEALTEKLLLAIGSMVAVKATPAQIEAQQIVSRDELRRIVNRAAKDSGDYAGTYNLLYQEIYYRLHINAKVRAENAKVSPMDIIEGEGLLGQAIAIAKEIF